MKLQYREQKWYKFRGKFIGIPHLPDVEYFTKYVYLEKNWLDLRHAEIILSI